jgi:hypothetical protein
VVGPIALAGRFTYPEEDTISMLSAAQLQVIVSLDVVQTGPMCVSAQKILAAFVKTVALDRHTG